MSEAATQLIEESLNSPSQPSERTRKLEVGLVCLVVIAPMILRGYIGYVLGSPSHLSAPNLSHLLTMTSELGGLALVAYVLSRSARTFASLGLQWRTRDLFYGAALGVAHRFVYGWAAFYLTLAYFWWTGGYYYRPNTGFLFDGNIAVLVIQLACVPFFEEIIVRGYLTHEFAELSGSIWFATFLSVMIQASYHIYQGPVAALSHIAAFSVSGIYYARTRNLLPCIVAHGVVDFTTMFIHLSRYTT